MDEANEETPLLDSDPPPAYVYPNGAYVLPSLEGGSGAILIDELPTYQQASQLASNFDIDMDDESPFISFFFLLIVIAIAAITLLPIIFKTDGAVGY